MRYFLSFILTAVYTCSILAAVLSPFLSTEIISGWDFTPQYYLVSSLKDFLAEWRYEGYDMNWFAGYPAFRFYGPLPYAVVTYVYDLLLHRGYIELDALVFAFNLTVYVLPFFLLLGLLLLSRIYFGRGYGIATLFISIIALTQAGVEHSAPFHLYSTLFHGHYASFFAFVLFVYFLAFFKLQCLTKSYFFRLISIFLIACIILSHAVTSLFVAIVLLCFFFFAGAPYRREAFIVAVASAVITSFWWIPFLQGLPFTSGEQIGISGFDPLQVFLPGVHTLRWCVGEGGMTALFALPYGGITFFVSLLFGLKYLVQARRYLLPMMFLGLLLFLPRNLLPAYFYLPVHYYRFLMPLFAFAIPIAAYGLCHLCIALYRVQYGRMVFHTILFLFLFLTAFSTAVLDYGFPASSLHPVHHTYMTMKIACPSRRSPEAPHSVKTERHYNDSQAVLRYFSDHIPDGRVAIEAIDRAGSQLGSPHYFATMLPLLYDIDVVPGLLAESSFSSSFLIPTLSYGSHSLLWGKSSLYARDPRAFFGPSFMIEDLMLRLREYRVQYVITVSKQYRDLLAEMNDEIVAERFTSGPYAVFEILHRKPKASSSSYKPFLYIERGGVPFRDFSEEWFKDDQFFSYPVISSLREYEELSQFEKDRIGGVILSYPITIAKELRAAEKEEVLSYTRPVIVLNRRRLQEGMENVTFIPDFDKEYIHLVNDGITQIREVITQAAVRQPVWRPIELVVDEEHRIEFQSEEGVLLRRSYASGWYGERSGVFLATPSLLYVLPQGQTVLRYK